MPVIDQPVHAKVAHGLDARYGCRNRPRPTAGAPVTGSPAYGSQEWPFVMSTDCMHDKSLVDAWCEGCAHQGQGEAYWAAYQKKLEEKK